MIAEPGRRIRVHIRWQIRRDMPEVLAIEGQCFAFPWGETEMLKALRQRDCLGYVAEFGEKILGFMIYLLRKDHIELLTLAVDPVYQRHQVGAQMVAKLGDKLSHHRRTHIRVDVRESNLSAQLFFKSQGFEAIKIERGGFADTGEDAYTMVGQHNKVRTLTTLSTDWTAR